LTQEDGLLTECAANLDNIQTGAKANLGPLVAALDQRGWSKSIERSGLRGNGVTGGTRPARQGPVSPAAEKPGGAQAKMGASPRRV